MTKEPQNTPKSSIELELLSLLLQSGDEVYPWDTTTVAAEAYFSEAEQQLAADNWLEKEAIATAPNFLSQLDSHWLATTAAQEPQQTLQAKLSAQFAAHVPQEWLEAIARQAIHAVHSQKSLGAQLVQCVQELIPNYLAEDLLVLARPYAHAMRSNPSQTTVQLEVTPEQWATLSPTQQAKLSLAIACYALEQIQAEDNI